MFSMIGMLPYLVTALVLGLILSVAFRSYLCWALRINEQLKLQRKLLEELKGLRANLEGIDGYQHEHSVVVRRLLKELVELHQLKLGPAYREPPKEG